METISVGATCGDIRISNLHSAVGGTTLIASSPPACTPAATKRQGMSSDNRGEKRLRECSNKTPTQLAGSSPARKTVRLRLVTSPSVFFATLWLQPVKFES